MILINERRIAEFPEKNLSGILLPFSELVWAYIWARVYPLSDSWEPREQFRKSKNS